MVKAFIRDETGATAIEYGLIATFLCVGIIASLGGLRTEYENMYAFIEGVMRENTVEDR